MKTPDVEIKIKFKGRYRCVLNEGTDREVDTGWFDNIVTDAGLDRVAQTTSPSTFVYGSIGTGTAAASASDTSLQAFVAEKLGNTFDSQSNLGPTNYESTCQFHYVYAQGDVVGNMAEVGVGWGASSIGIWSRARILDGSGNPTTLTVLSIDQLTVYYELTCANPTADITGTVSISGTPYAYTGRMASAASFMGALYNIVATANGGLVWGQIIGGGGSGASSVAKSYEGSSTLGAITGEPSGTSETSGSSNVASYTAGHFYRDSTLTLSPSEGIFSGGIGCILLNYLGATAQFQYQFTPPIPKNNTETLTLTARFSWGR